MSHEIQIFTEFKNGRMEMLYKHFYPGLVQFACRFLGEEKFYAEDCVQNAIYKAWTKKEDFDSVYTLKAFLYTSIKNEIINIQKKTSAKSRYLSKQENIEDHDTFLKAILDQEAYTQLFEAINAMPETERRVCILSYIDGLNNSEIAEELHLSLATVKRYKAKALNILRNTLDPFVLLLLLSLGSS